MLRVQFNNSKSMIEADFKMISEDVVQLTGKKVKPNTSGFKTYRLNGVLLGDYSQYTRIVKKIRNGVQFGKSK